MRVLGKNEDKVCIVGLGYIGLTLAVALANNGFQVFGFDVNKSKVDKINEGESPFFEVGFEEELKKVISTGSLRTSSKLDEIEENNFWIITVGTPLKDTKLDLSGIFEVIQMISPLLRNEDQIVLRSTVAIGTAFAIKGILDTKDLKCSVAVCPERTVEGSAYNELHTLPQIIGTDSRASQDRLIRFFDRIGVECVIAESPKEAEMAKLLCNAYRDLLFAFANEVALIGDTLGINSSNAISIARQNYPRAPLALPGPVGGPCLIKDGLALNSYVTTTNRQSLMATARQVNQEVAEWPLKIIRKTFKGRTPPNTIAILGLAFKGQPETNDDRSSLAYEIAKQLKAELPNINIYGWDPVPSTKIEFKHLINLTDLHTIFSSAQVLIIQNNHPFFNSPYFLEKIKDNNSLIIDFWRQVPIRSNTYRFGEGRV